MDPHDTNRQIANALGCVVIPLVKADCHTHAEGVVCLYAEPYRGRLYTHPGRAFGDELEWSPATNAADALAALKAYAEQTGSEWCIGCERDCEQPFARLGKGPGPVMECRGETECEAICKVILEAKT